MRTSLRFLLAASLLASAAMPVAGQAVFGIGAEDGCGGLVGNDTENAVLIGVKVPTSGSCTDILFDLSQVGGQVASGSTGLNPGDQWSISPNWRVPQVAADVHFIFLLYGPAAGTQANRIIMDSGTINDQFFGVAMRMTVGNSLPSSFDSAPGSNTKGIDLVLPTSGVNYSVRLSGGGAAAPPATTGFPRGANGGVEVAFAPLAEINQSEPVGGCALSGLNPMPSAPNNPALDGAIIGYNVYRLAGTSGSPPTAAAFYTASLNADPTDGWQYYMPLTQSYNLTTMDNLGLAGPTPPAASDMNPDDLGGLQNPDGINYTGDEVMIFQDSASNRGTGRATGSAPVVGQGYWYTFQPVMCGSITDFSAAMGWGSGNVFNGDHGNSASAAAAGDDSLDLDLDGTNEFFSPQADFGLPGLGFMYNGALFMTQPVFGQIDPAPAAGGLVLTGSLSGQSVNLQFQTTLESGNVTSFKVYRGAGSSRVLVGQPIAAQGTESSLYQLVDDAVQARRVSRGGAVEYTVDVVYDDGHTSTVGPFSVTLDRATGGGRRTR